MPGSKTVFFVITLSFACIQSVRLFGVVYFSNSQISSFKQDVEQFGNSVIQFKIEEVDFPVQKNKTSSETFIRKGLLITRPQALGTVIVCHGFTQSKQEAAFFRTFFPHFNVFAFDFRAHGDLIEGQYSTIGSEEIFDVKGAVDFVKNRPGLEGQPVIGFGFSMGAVSLIQAQAEYPDLFQSLILDSPFDSSTDCMSKSLDKMLTVNLFGQRYQIPGRTIIMKCLYSQKLQPAMRQIFRYATGFRNFTKTKFVPVHPVENATRITIPCFFITCEKDQKVPVGCVRRLYDTVHSNYKRLWITHGTRHCGSCINSPEFYAYRVNRFISDVLDKSWSVADEVYDDRVVLTLV
jgi:pimeloyl-ACP methyl ester carboxylesterase